MTDRKRFIAGAVCPKCSRMDKIVVYQDEEKKYRECVSCGFKDEMVFESPVREIDTRVNRDREQPDTETQVLRFPPSDDETP
jgi:uncharacterized metal-binding protein (TIGR02443 family)